LSPQIDSSGDRARPTVEHRIERRGQIAPRDLETRRQRNGRYEDLAAGALGELTARYVIGCDGARSTVRRFMGAALQDLRSHERWIVLDMILGMVLS